MGEKINFKTFFVIILSVFILLFLFFKFGPKIPISVLTQEKGQPLVVEGTGKVTAPYDNAKITVGVSDSGPVLSEVVKSVNTKSKNLTEALKKEGVSDKNIKTTAYNIHPQYDYNVTPNKINGYQVNISYEITVEEIDNLNKIVDAATVSGANNVGGITFDVNEKTKTEKLQEAREIAAKEAKLKAEGLAKAAGISLGKVINISESQGISPRPIPMYAALKENSTDTSANIQTGENEISVTVSLSFEIR
jgi:hypothetical protein